MVPLALMVAPPSLPLPILTDRQWTLRALPLPAFDEETLRPPP